MVRSVQASLEQGIMRVRCEPAVVCATVQLLCGPRTFIAVRSPLWYGVTYHIRCHLRRISVPLSFRPLDCLWFVGRRCLRKFPDCPSGESFGVAVERSGMVDPYWVGRSGTTPFSLHPTNIVCCVIPRSRFGEQMSGAQATVFKSVCSCFNVMTPKRVSEADSSGL